jgi:hypothetical protein
LKTKVEEEELYDIRDLILKLPKVADTDALLKYVEKNIEAFRVDNEKFHDDMKNNSEIIRRYDEVLSMKASTIALDTKL